ncbi:Calexcitin-2 [Papilio machaon]|uniref:Calexcitin-2 n=1 Tax=Papilio machaon TaxID=76193 RepID=A0A0N0PB40_PAPMA|nr:Calexcitin-2 [Papilio machaon]
MVSEFRKKKLLFLHRFFDKDAGGTVEKKDFEQAAENISNSRGWKQGDAKYKETFDTLLKVWSDLESVADADKDGAVTADEWIAMWDALCPEPVLGARLAESLQDATSDGAIDSEEFSSVCVSFGGSKDQAVTAFQKMSKGKSTISWAEFQELWREFFAAEDPSAPGNFIFGTSTF